MFRITIDVETEDQKDEILDVLDEGEINGDLDFSFSVHTDELYSLVEDEEDEI